MCAIDRPLLLTLIAWTATDILVLSPFLSKVTKAKCSTMDTAILDMIETELIFVKEERTRLKDKKANLERIRAALKSKGALSGSTIITNIKKEGKRKNDKDPNKPKRPQSAYNLFYQDKAQIYKEAHPTTAQKEIMSIIGPQWKDCPPEEKAVYENKARELKAEFEIKLAAYHAGKTGEMTFKEVPDGAIGFSHHDDDDDDDDSEDEGLKKKTKREK